MQHEQERERERHPGFEHVIPEIERPWTYFLDLVASRKGRNLQIKIKECGALLFVNTGKLYCRICSSLCTCLTQLYGGIDMYNLLHKEQLHVSALFIGHLQVDK